MKRIAVLGASGFVGSTFVEQLLARGDAEVVPCIHSSGNAMRLARHGIELKMLDLRDAAAVDAALSGATHVVNSSAGGEDVMLGGLKNALEASRKLGARRFVHLSSVAVYGDPPPPASVREDAPATPARGTYGFVKLEQDRMVRKAAEAGLPCTILCPPNIGGPYSYFLVAVVEALRGGRFELLDDGAATCNLVDVSNLCRAMELALDDGPRDGRRMFVTDDENTRWRDLIDALAPLTESGRPVPRVSRDALLGLSVSSGAPSSLGRSLRHLVSSDVREALRRDPLWERVDSAMRRGVARMGRAAEDSIRYSIEGPTRVAKIAAGPPPDAGLSRQQLRGVRHSCDLAKELIGYGPLHTFAQSVSAFRHWYRASHGADTAYWPLLKQLQD